MYDMINPQHYQNGTVETIEKMRRIWGDEKVAMYCEITAFKYRERIGTKPDNSLEQEMGKIKWYESKAKELRTTQPGEQNDQEENSKPDYSNESVDIDQINLFSGSHVTTCDKIRSQRDIRTKFGSRRNEHEED